MKVLPLTLLRNSSDCFWLSISISFTKSAFAHFLITSFPPRYTYCTQSSFDSSCLLCLRLITSSPQLRELYFRNGGATAASYLNLSRENNLLILNTRLTLTQHDRLFDQPTLSDVKIAQTINSSTREYYAHKAILCSQSKYFMKAFTGNFKVRSQLVE